MRTLTTEAERNAYFLQRGEKGEGGREAFGTAKRRSSSNSPTMWWSHYFRTLRYSSEASSVLAGWRHGRREQ